MDFDAVEASTEVDVGALLPCARIVVVDDDDDMRAIVALTLRHLGIEVIEARHGLQVLDYVTHLMLEPGVALPDVIVSDAQMPGVNGITLLESLRGSGCEVPVIFLTAFDGPNFRERAKHLGAADVLEKPLDRDALRAAVLKQLGR